MNRPSLSTRIAGSPRVAVLLFGGSGFVGWAWYQGHLTWWWLLIAVFTASKTLEAVLKMRRYKEWVAEWEATASGGTALPVKKRGRRVLRFLIAIALLLVLGIPIIPPSVEGNSQLSQQQLGAAWLSALVFLVAVVIWRVRRWLKSRRGIDAGSAKENDAVVEWTLGRAMSSPGRAEAQANLPEYCTWLMGPDQVGVGARKP